MTDQSGMIAFWKEKAQALKLQTLTLYYATRSPVVPWYAKGFAALIVAYAFSPIDLIPDFIPVLGYLDDLIIVPLGVFLALKMIPAHVLAGCRLEAEAAAREELPGYKFMGVVIVSLWLILLLFVGVWVFRAIRK
jgi:uncharacterized membrane protein YkvA (DUF1232 family)